MRSMDIAATGMAAQQLNIEVISNNIANANTTGYKAQRADFQDLLYQNERQAGDDSSDNGTIVPSGIQVGVGVKAAAIVRLDQQGNLTQTSNPLDLAIQGKGYFQVLMPDGTTSYTRDGSFQLSSTGEIVTADGYVVQPGITLPSNTTAVTVDSTGDVIATVAGNSTPQTVGKLQLAAFPNDAGLNAIGANLFQETQASGQPVTGTPGTQDIGTLQQGYLETSNVDIVTEITNLISAQRAYEMNSKVVQTADEMQKTLTQMPT